MCRPAPFVVVTCPACGMAEDFDLACLPCGSRALPLDCLPAKLRCHCGSRQRMRVERTTEPGPRHDPPRVVVWYC